ncbi:MAG: hypothetical protein QOG28_4522, partial [Trebonia sp.]|nr:hypothetical protein [Trebonia sp.]
MMRPVSHAPSAAHFFQILQLCSAASPSTFPFQSAHIGGYRACLALRLRCGGRDRR